jgi:eukaryotic-like serine/threonine-protein kinase
MTDDLTPSTSHTHVSARGAPASRRFQIEREVGRGAAGIVYRAYDTVTQRTVALKVLAAREEAEEARFEREGNVLSALSHPGVVQVVAAGTLDDHAPFLAMEWLEGEDLATRQKTRPLSLRASLAVAEQVARALSAAHAAGIVHRDVKPSNVFLVGEPPIVKLVDFGVASQGDVRLTNRGHLVGTPAYMAPEQARGERVVDARADLFALGATLFELIAGRPPHVGPTPIATLARLVTTPAPLLSELVPSVPPALDELLALLLATNPEERPATATEVADAILALASGPGLDGKVDASTRDDGPVPTSLTTGSRLVTSIVALGTPTVEARATAIREAIALGADAVPLGQDGVVAHLGARRTLGDEAPRALGIGKMLAKAGARVGVATGRARVDTVRPVGEVVDRAASLARAADRAQVVADTTTTELARGRYELQHRGDGSALVGESLAEPKDSPGGAPFLGREAELAQILQSYERAEGDETPVVASCSGAPGIGKTRLGREVLARIGAGGNPPRLVVVRCESFGSQHALGAAAEILRGLAGVGKSVAAEAALSALYAVLGDTLRGTEDSGLLLLASLLEGGALEDGNGARDALWLAMTDVVNRLADHGPVAIVVEDAQWADPESVAWLDHLLGRAESRALWILVLVRPAFFDTYPKLFAGRDHVRLELRPVSKRATKAIARAVLRERATDELVDLVAQRAAGSPLFAEELARLSASGRDASMAPTIEAAIQVSLDALSLELRDTIGRLSAFGLAGWEGGLTAMGVKDPGTDLRKLAAAELVVERAESRFPGEREWTFKHALVRDVVYASLPPDLVKKLHEEAARFLEGVGEDAATVAKHFDLGGNAERAADHWERAARRALATNSLVEAVSMADRALPFAEEGAPAFARALLLDEAWVRLDARAADRETAIFALSDNVYDDSSRVRAEGARVRYDDARGAGDGDGLADRLEAVRASAAALGLHDEEARCSAALAARLAYAGKNTEAEDEASRLLVLSERHNLPSAALDAWQTLAIARQTQGELIAALDARRNAVKAAATAGLKEREATLMINVGFALTTIGARQEARAHIEQGIALALALGTPGTLRLGRMVLLGWSAAFGADRTLDAALAEPREEADLAATGGWIASDRVTLGILFYRGLELLQNKSPDAAVRGRALLRTAAEAYRSTGMLDILPVALGAWADAERRCGDTERAATLAAEGVKLLESGAPSLLNESSIYLALHEALLQLGREEEARDVAQRGLSPLARRVRGLAGSAYPLAFLTSLPANAGLLAAAEEHAHLPREIESVLDRGQG